MAKSQRCNCHPWFLSEPNKNFRDIQYGIIYQDENNNYNNGNNAVYLLHANILPAPQCCLDVQTEVHTAAKMKRQLLHCPGFGRLLLRQYKWLVDLSLKIKLTLKRMKHPAMGLFAK